MTHDQTHGTIAGLISMGAIQVVEEIPNADVITLCKLVIQGLVALGTLWHLWKTRNNASKNNEPDNNE